MENIWLHSQQVANVSHLLAGAMEVKEGQADVIFLAGLLHDVGKIGIPRCVLGKRNKLTGEDWMWIKKHPVIGARIVRLGKFNSNGNINEMILFHHERYDGKGYPLGLKGKDIPMGSRIIAVADTLSALQQDRPYRRRISFHDSLEEILRNSGSQFDADVIGALEAVQNRVRDYLCSVSSLSMLSRVGEITRDFLPCGLDAAPGEDLVEPSESV